MVGNGGKLLNSDCDQFSATYFRQRPYSVEHTRSHLNSEVKQPKARSVLGWGTAWEVLRVLLAFLFGFSSHQTSAKKLSHLFGFAMEVPPLS